MGLSYHRKTSTGETQFVLVYGAEAMEPAELICLSVRAEMMNWEDNDVKMARELDLIDERRDWLAEVLRLTSEGL